MKRKCKIRINDEVNCVISNLHPDHVAYFHEEYAKFAPNHFFNPKFKLGSWDGRVYYFHKTGKTYVNLLPDIIPRLIGLGYEIDLDDHRESAPVEIPEITKDFFADLGVMDAERGVPWEMRDYQVDMINALTSNGGGIGICGTGGGKTSMTAALALLYEIYGGLRSIIIVPDKNLTTQTHKEYEFFGVDAGQYSGEVKDLQHKHVVSTWQSLKNNPSMLLDFDMVIVDECHGIRGQILSKLMNEVGRNIPFRFGVTGTLPKAETDLMAVHISVGDVQYNIPASELIDRKHLASLHIDIVQLETDFKEEYQEYCDEVALMPGDKPKTYRKFKDEYFPDYTSEKQFCQNEKRRLAWIATKIEQKRDAGKGNVLCLVDGVRFGKKLTGLIEGAVFLSGKDKMKDRLEVYELFDNNDNLVVIATVQIASTGLNIKRIYNMMFIDVGKSFIRVIQSIGRGLRKAPDKDHVDVTDIHSDLKYGRKHATERAKFYSEAQYPFSKSTVDYSADINL